MLACISDTSDNLAIRNSNSTTANTRTARRDDIPVAFTILLHGQAIQHRIHTAVEKHQHHTYVHPRGPLSGVAEDEEQVGDLVGSPAQHQGQGSNGGDFGDLLSYGTAMLKANIRTSLHLVDDVEVQPGNNGERNEALH